MRVFRCTSAAFAVVCSRLDEALGMPRDSQTTSVVPHEDALSRSGGAVFLLLTESECRRQEVAATLPSLIDLPGVDEIAYQDYLAMFPPV